MDIERKRGDTYPIQITVLENGVGMNISGTSFTLTVDPAKLPTTAVNNIMSLAGVIVNAATGRVDFTPAPADVDHVGKYYHDVQMVDGAGLKRTVVDGKFTLIQDIGKS